MIELEVDNEGLIYSADHADEPRMRTWLELLNDNEEWEKVSDEDKPGILDRYGLETESDLSKNVPEEILFDIYSWDTPHGAAYLTLSEIIIKEEWKKVLAEQECPSIGSSFRGIELIGSRSELRKLIRDSGLESEFSIKLSVEVLRNEAQTEYVKQRLHELYINNDDDEELADDLLTLERYIFDGEPELNGLALKFGFGPTLTRFPPNSEEYKRIKEEY